MFSLIKGTFSFFLSVLVIAIIILKKLIDKLMRKSTRFSSESRVNFFKYRAEILFPWIKDEIITSKKNAQGNVFSSWLFWWNEYYFFLEIDL